MSDQSSPAAKAVSIAADPKTIIIDNPPTNTSAPPRRATSSHKPFSRRRVPPSPALAPSILTRDVVPRVSLDKSPQHSRGNSLTDAPQVLEDYLTHGAQNSSAASAAVEPHSSILHQIREWVHQERKRRRERHERRRQRRYAAAHPLHPHQQHEDSGDSADESLNALEALLAGSPVATPGGAGGGPTPGSATATPADKAHRRKPQRKRSLISITAPSDTEYASDGEAVVPTCEERLGTAEELGMDRFKEEVLKLTHTLKCKGWRRVSLDRWSEIGVKRISGALTNAVYMISPPKDVPPPTPSGNSTSEVNLTKGGKGSKYPTSLLLRIYGPQVSHLIDRDTELSILRRLARQKIGPRLLGTFINGRFEEFFPSSTLTKDDIRRPEVSRHIAKRLKELHEGIDVTPAERAAGPIVWKNWDKWEQRASEVIARYESHTPGSAEQILGSSWSAFAAAVSKYREWLTERCGGEEGVRQQLVFAHNDTQYGNILRLQTASNSPLLLPSNEHRQLIVIDFEYASANTPAYEFANHFCEWMSDYHDANAPHLVHANRYPTMKEQRNFLRAYVEHSLRASRAAAAGGSKRNSGVFDLDGGKSGREAEEDEKRKEEATSKEVERWVQETRVWRAAVHAMWAAWGIVQAKDEIAEREDREAAARAEGAIDGEAAAAAEEKRKKEEEEDEEEAFDYFGYAREKAGLFWSDVEALGLLKDMQALEKPPGWAKKVVDV